MRKCLQLPEDIEEIPDEKCGMDMNSVLYHMKKRGHKISSKSHCKGLLTIWHGKKHGKSKTILGVVDNEKMEFYSNVTFPGDFKPYGTWSVEPISDLFSDDIWSKFRDGR